MSEQPTTPRRPTLVVREDLDGFRVVLKSGNGLTLAVTESYDSVSNARRARATLIAAVQDVALDDLLTGQGPTAPVEKGASLLRAEAAAQDPQAGGDLP